MATGPSPPTPTAHAAAATAAAALLGKQLSEEALARHSHVVVTRDDLPITRE